MHKPSHHLVTSKGKHEQHGVDRSSTDQLSLKSGPPGGPWQQGLLKQPWHLE